MYGLQEYFNPLLCSYTPVKKLYVFMKDSQNDPDTEFGSEPVSYPAARVSMVVQSPRGIYALYFCALKGSDSRVGDSWAS